MSETRIIPRDEFVQRVKDEQHEKRRAMDYEYAMYRKRITEKCRRRRHKS